VLISLPVSLGLLGLFFVPWLTLSCDPKGLTLPPEIRGGSGVPKELRDGAVLAHASGWDLARGELTPADRFKEQAKAARGQQQGPPAKHWAYGGLVLPGMLVLVGLLCLSGKLTASGAGKWMLLLGIGGVVVMSLAASMDYVEEAVDKATDQMAAQGAPFGGRAFQRQLDQAIDKAKDVLQTKATPYLWGCLALYGLTAVCGLASIGAPEPRRTAKPAAWKTDRGDPCAYLRGIPSTPGREPREPAGMPSFGPGVGPRQAPSPVGGDEASGSQGEIRGS
jgi:hypothetical protein